MFILELFLPLRDNHGQAFPRTVYASVRTELAQHFGGVTAFMRSPAVGIWKDDGGTARHDEIVVFEVMCEELEVEWWQTYRTQLERTFRQQEILIRATRTTRI